MEVVEMLDNLKEKARRDPALREMLIATRRGRKRRWLLSVRSAGSLGFRFMRWI